MKKITSAIVGAGLCAAFLPAAPASAQFLGYDPLGVPICASPYGPVVCPGAGAPPPPPVYGTIPAPSGPPGMNGLPGAGMLPRDGQIVAGIYQSCGGEPRCMAAAWAAVEVQRCRGGFGVQGGCFGPNGEIMKVVNRFLPHNFRPNVVIRNMENDIRNGPGPNNEICKHTFFC